MVRFYRLFSFLMFLPVIAILYILMVAVMIIDFVMLVLYIIRGQHKIRKYDSVFYFFESFVDDFVAFVLNVG